MDEAMRSYRQDLIKLEQKAQGAYDKTVLSLAGGALAVSFAFVKDFLSPEAALAQSWLVAAWAAWVISLSAVLISHYLSTFALRKAIVQLDSAAAPGKWVGGPFEVATTVLNGLGGAAFIVGLILSGVFVSKNIG